MFTKLHTVAASNNRVHSMRSLYYYLFVPHLYVGCSSRTFCSWWNAHSAQGQLRGCNNISFLQLTTAIARSFCEGFIRHDLHILVTPPFSCDRRARAACSQSFTLWQQATTDFTSGVHRRFSWGGLVQGHMVGGLVQDHTLFVTSQFDIIFMFPNQRFGEVCWHKMHDFLHLLPLFYVSLHWILTISAPS